MKKGAFALIDCLGFKGLWKNGHEQLLTKLSLIKTSVADGLREASKNSHHPFHFHPDDFKPEIRLLSDTVAISIQDKKKIEGYPALELLAIAVAVQIVIDLFLENEPHLLLRGCITHDTHLIKENFLIGPAVDETAAYMDSAQGAFVWFFPSAAKIIESNFITHSPNLFFDVMCPSYQVPIKGGHYLNTRVINPIISKTSEVADRLIGVCAKAMDENRMDVWMKRQHTLEFLSYCKERNGRLRESFGGIQGSK